MTTEVRSVVPPPPYAIAAEFIRMAIMLVVIELVFVPRLIIFAVILSEFVMMLSTFVLMAMVTEDRSVEPPPPPPPDEIAAEFAEMALVLS